MAPQKRKDKPMVLLKSVVLVITCLSFGGILSCDWGSGTKSTTSSGSGTGTGWTITVQVGTNPIPFGGSTAIMATVRDRTGAPAPSGTYVCMTAVNNDFLKPGDNTAYKTLCDNTPNDLGQYVQTYFAKSTTGDDTVQISSQGVINTVIIHVI